MPDDDIVVVEYDPGWPPRFNAERLRIIDALAPLAFRVEHVGSTSVPGLCAKPVIDILVGVDEFLPAEVYSARLQELGYRWGDSEENGRHFFAKVPRTAHVHVVRYRSWDWYSKIFLRDVMRGDVEFCREYAALKRDLASKYHQDRSAYSHGKDALVEERLRTECSARLVRIRGSGEEKDDRAIGP